MIIRVVSDYEAYILDRITLVCDRRQVLVGRPAVVEMSGQ